MRRARRRGAALDARLGDALPTLLDARSGSRRDAARSRSRSRSRCTTSTMSRFALKTRSCRSAPLPLREDRADALELALGAELARVRLDLLQRPPHELRDGNAVPLAGGEVHDRRLEPVAAGEPLVLGREDAVVRRDRPRRARRARRAASRAPGTYAVIAIASSRRVTASQIRTSTVPSRGCGRMSHQMCV